MLKALMDGQARLYKKIASLEELLSGEIQPDSQLKLEAVLDDDLDDDVDLIRPRYIEEAPKIHGKLEHKIRHGDGTVDHVGFETME